MQMPTKIDGGPSERTIVFCVAAVQFVNILDFMIVMPLGPDFAVALGIPLSHLGYVGGAYTASACVSGLAGALFLDKLDRRTALGVAMLGLVLGTLSGAFARDLTTLMLARVVAGAFGGTKSLSTTPASMLEASGARSPTVNLSVRAPRKTSLFWIVAGRV
jgi:predicted MFS family arabinose efflux permease